MTRWPDVPENFTYEKYISSAVPFFRTTLIIWTIKFRLIFVHGTNDIKMEISRTNHAIICLYYYPQRFCNFHMSLLQANQIAEISHVVE